MGVAGGSAEPDQLASVAGPRLCCGDSCQRLEAERTGKQWSCWWWNNMLFKMLHRHAGILPMMELSTTILKASFLAAGAPHTHGWMCSSSSWSVQAALTAQDSQSQSLPTPSTNAIRVLGGELALLAPVRWSWLSSSTSTKSPERTCMVQGVSGTPLDHLTTQKWPQCTSCGMSSRSEQRC